jgi:hypothetical protein
MQHYDTLTAALTGLKAKGYTLDLNIAFDKLVCSHNNVCLNPNEFEITEVHRFEGDTNPSDEDVVYAVESHDHKIKGTITSAYGMYADTISTDMLRKISINK